MFDIEFNIVAIIDGTMFRRWTRLFGCATPEEMVEHVLCEARDVFEAENVTVVFSAVLLGQQIVVTEAFRLNDDDGWDKIS